MPYDFGKLDALQAEALITAAVDVALQQGEVDPAHTPGVYRSHAESVRRFYDDDHWQNGDGWMGPKPILSKDAASTTTLAEHARRFVFRNKIKEVVKRHVNGITGIEPRWGFTPVRPIAEDQEPNKKEAADIDLIESALTTWWDKRKLHKLFQGVEVEELLSGRAVIRLLVPASRLREIAAPAAADGEDQQTPTRGVIAATLEDALDQIFVEVVIAERGVVYTDTDSMEEIGVVVYYAQGEKPGMVGPKVIETTYLGGNPTQPRAERPTVIRIVTNASETPVQLSLGGHLMHHAVERDPLVTPALISMQKALNMNMSMIPRNAETSGFTERTLIDAQTPFTLEDDGKGGKKLVQRNEFVTGPGVTNFVESAIYTDETGKQIKGSPQIVYKEPSPMTPTIEGVDTLSAEMLGEAKQGHVLGTDQAQSGVSRTQARADYTTSLGESKSGLDPAGRWLLETALALACTFATDNEGVNPEEYRATFACVPYTGPLDPTEVTNQVNAAEQGVISTQRAQEALGVEDTDAEMARMNAEPGKRIALRKAKADAMKSFTDAGLSAPLAAKLAGFEDDEVTAIEKDIIDNPTPAPVPGLLNPDGTPVIDPNAPTPSSPSSPPAPAPAPAPPNANPADAVAA